MKMSVKVENLINTSEQCDAEENKANFKILNFLALFHLQFHGLLLIQFVCHSELQQF